MKRTLLIIAVFSFCILLVSFSHRNNNAVHPPRATVRTLVIDAGHGGIDPGAKGLFSTEAEVSLAVALKFGKVLEKEFPDLKIVYTRTEDVIAGNKRNKDDANRYRADLANASGGDLFIAIHCNSAGRRPGGWYEKVVTGKTPYKKTVKKKGKKTTVTAYRYTYANVWRENTAHGTETYIWAVNKNDIKINSVNKNEESYGEMETDSTSTLVLPDPSDPVEKARMLIYAQQYFRKSLNLADLIEKEFVETGRVSRGVKQRNHTGIWVLQATGMPSVLVEIGFISNKEEEEYINSERGQTEIVEDMVNAFRAYKQKLESKTVEAAR
ncbi:MAG: N-acetylmuramoyl-L-alanine amidase [Chitinophagaceae bacterium]|nr:N-acetylmuramoyl-L-alanine amidase [Chitinophagaceae bacterium]